MKKITTQIELIVQIVRCIHFKKELSNLDQKPHLNFWRLIHGGLLDLSVLEWTKIFGVDAEPTHWKGVVDDKKTFRRDLLKRIGLTKEEWRVYWDCMTSYRNECVTHHCDNPESTHYPKLDIALTSCYFYYDYLINKARSLGETRYPDDLEEYCNRFSEQINAIAKLALKATENFQEKVM